MTTDGIGPLLLGVITGVVAIVVGARQIRAAGAARRQQAQDARRTAEAACRRAADSIQKAEAVLRRIPRGFPARGQGRGQGCFAERATAALDIVAHEVTVIRAAATAVGDMASKEAVIVDQKTQELRRVADALLEQHETIVVLNSPCPGCRKVVKLLGPLESSLQTLEQMIAARRCRLQTQCDR